MDTDPIKQAMREYFRALGSKGGKKGGKKRWADKTAEERSAAMKALAAKRKAAQSDSTPADWREAPPAKK